MTGVYLLFVWLFGCILSNDLLISDKLVASRVAWPTHYLVSIGEYRPWSVSERMHRASLDAWHVRVLATVLEW